MRKIILYAAIAVTICAANGQSFQKINTGVIPLANAVSHWVDFNNDGLYDLFTSGTLLTGAHKTCVYLNNGNNTFSSIQLTPLSDYAVDFADYNGDSFVDIFMTGIDNLGFKQSYVFQNAGGNGFLVIDGLFEKVSNGSVLSKDLDNDGDVDVLLTGLDVNNASMSALYKNQGGAFVIGPSLIPGVSNGVLKVFDANNDGANEILVSGILGSGDAILKIYTADSKLNLSHYAELEGFAFNDLDVGDVTGDGFVDVVTTGLTFPAFDRKNTLLQNNALGNFVAASLPLIEDLALASVANGDFDNDGHSDLVLTGQDVNDATHFYYLHNDANGTFSSSTTSVTPIYNGKCSLADVDNDGDLDLFQIGKSDVALQANLYESNQSTVTTNTPPSIPQNLNSVVNGDEVSFLWDKSNDDHTKEPSITYNLYISRKPGGQDLLLAPDAIILTGRIKIPGNGNAGYANHKSIYRLPEGKYYWAVQAIDNGYAASAFSQEQSFAVCYGETLSDDLSICKGDTVQFAAGKANDTVNWYSVNEGPLAMASSKFTHIVSKSSSIAVEVVRDFGCTVKDTVHVTMLNLPIINIGSDVSVCKGEPFSRDLDASYDSVRWYTVKLPVVSKSYTIAFTAKDDDIIFAQVFDSQGCQNTDTLAISVLALPVFSAGPDLSICERSNATVVAQGQWSSVRWFETVTHRSAEENSFSFAVSENHLVVGTVTDANGCSSSDSVYIKTLPLPEVNGGPDVGVCYNEQLIRVASTGLHEQSTWIRPSGEIITSNDTLIHTITEDETIILKKLNSDLCENSDTVKITALALPQFSIGKDTAICHKKSLLLKAPAKLKRVDWLSNGVIEKPDSWYWNYEVKQTASIIAKVEDVHGCVSWDTIQVSVLPLPSYSLGPDPTLCIGDSLHTTVPGNWAQVNWYDGDGILIARASSSITARILADARIASEVKDFRGCIAFDTLFVKVNALPVFDLGPDKTVCFNDSVSFSCNVPGSKYQWTFSQTYQPISSSSHLTLVADHSLIVSAQVEDEHHCIFKDSLQLIVNPLPRFLIEGDTAVCDGSVLELQVKGSELSVFRWLANDSIISEGPFLHFVPRATGMIQARVRNDKQCESKRDIYVTVLPVPELKLMADTLICFGEQLYLDGDLSADSFQCEWEPKESLDNSAIRRPRASPITSTTYALELSNSFGCQTRDSVRVEVNPQIIIDAGPDASICDGGSVTLGGKPTASGSNFPFHYSWLSTSSAFQSSLPNPTVSPKASALYYVFVTTGRCSAVYDSIYVNVNTRPDVTASETQSVGNHQSAQLSAHGAVKYVWSPEESLDDFTSSNPIATPSQTTTYHVTGYDENGCRDEAETTVLVQNSLFVPNLFTPNGDGMNDSFRLYGSGIESIRLSIFDSQGNSVFSSADKVEILENGWDGTLKGKSLKNDSYIWVIDGVFGDGNPVNFHGNRKGVIKLMR